MRNENGFTLMEALVALVVLAVSGIALMGATEQHVRRIVDLEDRAVAQWIGENRMAELAIAGTRPTEKRDTVRMLGAEWTVTQSVEATDDPDLARIDLRVGALNQTATQSRMIGFVDTGAAQ